MSTKEIRSRGTERVKKKLTISGSIGPLPPKRPWMRLLLMTNHIREFREQRCHSQCESQTEQG